MRKLISIYLFSLLALSLFLVSESFANPVTSTRYISIIGCYVFIIFSYILNEKNQAWSISVSEILVMGFLLSAILYNAYLRSLSFEWILSSTSLLLFYMLVRRIRLDQQLIFVGIVILGIIQAAYGIAQYLNWTNNDINSFRINGSFDNPTGFAVSLVVVFPFALYLFFEKKTIVRLLGALSVGFILVSVILSGSRAGIVGLVVILLIWLFYVLNIQFSKKLKVVVSSIIIIALIFGLYFVKKDSADGRLLIWQCSTQMIVDKPLFGHGVGSFEREYMLYQADYFKIHPYSRYAMLAGIVKHPFNEFLLLLVELGLTGGLLMGLCIYCLIREYKRNKSIEKFYALLCVIGVAVFGCFSYFLCYPFIRIVALFSIAVIMKHEQDVLVVPQQISMFIKPPLTFACIILLTVTIKMFKNEYRWNIIAQQSLAGETKKVMPEYAQLYKTMNKNGLFLYNYGAELNYIGEWRESTKLLKECADFYNDIDLQLLLADNYTHLKQYHKAEKCLLLAHKMIPNRFTPLYRLAILYKKEGKLYEASRIANIILKKPVKVVSIDVLTIKKEMKDLLN
ncbi:MAG: O-antigen ligase family protein [Paludibacter sp.]|nr:O-antigen ligase family protein [Paludibacter sp.]MDD4199354.1 O-antigen ligase family protein [Paludibacter sp.]MDD4427805.1 O-antigen ligase family protein [Paludibacter sp.]